MSIPSSYQRLWDIELAGPEFLQYLCLLFLAQPLIMIPAGLALQNAPPGSQDRPSGTGGSAVAVSVVGEDHDPQRIRIGLYLLQKYPPGRSGQDALP